MAIEIAKVIEDTDRMIVGILTQNATNISRRMQKEGDAFKISSLEIRSLLELRKVSHEITERREKALGIYNDPQTPDAKQIKAVVLEAMKSRDIEPTPAIMNADAPFPKGKRARSHAAQSMTSANSG